MFFPRKREGMDLENFLRDHSFNGLEVSADQSESSWRAGMFVPVEQLTALGATWGESAEWTIFCGRYNYNHIELVDPELSMAPALSQTNYHLTDEYAVLVMSYDQT